MKKYCIDWELSIDLEDSDYLENIQQYGVDLHTNQIYLVSNDAYIGEVYEPSDLGVNEPGVEFSMVTQFIMNLNILMRLNPGEPILIHMKTAGGLWEEGMAIYDIIKACPSPVTILSYTHARSMSSLIFLAANKRVMMPNSYFMAHDGTLAVSGTTKSSKSYVKFTDRQDEIMRDIYVEAMQYGEHAAKSDEMKWAWLRRQMDKKEEVYFTAEEAVQYGFCDEVFGANGDFDWRTLTQYTKEQIER